ncbi:MAG: glycosyltransferase family 2 protein [Bacteroidia bacterium]|jgi:glycosyltransferase involved in cell wall biosynthesis
MSAPKITVITVVYNGQQLIERTVKSVVEQTYSNIEYLIIDGASKDNTLSVIQPYSSKITRIISEKDKGIYDAMNKGLQLATGDYVLFINAGDELFSKNTLTEVFSKNNNADAYYGNTAVTNEAGQQIGDRRLAPPEQLNWKSLKHGMCVSHQSFIAKRTLCSNYNLNYQISADFDWVINVLKKSKNVVNTHTYISKFLEGGASKQRQIQGLKERLKIMIQQYGFIPALWNHFYILLRYPIHKLTRKSMT